MNCQEEASTVGHKQSWQKLGLVFIPDQGPEWMKSHAQVPTPLLCDGFIRVYFSSRPKVSLSLTSFVDLDLVDPTRVLRIHPEPILELGKPGTFDEHGIMPSCAVREGNRVYLYYSGWQRGTTVPYTNSTGLAISEDGGETFRKISEGPILSKNKYDPYSATSPCVLHGEDGWHMWYCSGEGWLEINDKYEHTYNIKYAHSLDGVMWKPTGESVLAQSSSEEAITRPWVLNIGGCCHMWFCYRGSRSFRDGSEAYRIGYALYNDKKGWMRLDQEAGIQPTVESWDSRTIAYPAVIVVKNKKLMFYNGNGFGADGFGLAICEL